VKKALALTDVFREGPFCFALASKLDEESFAEMLRAALEKAAETGAGNEAENKAALPFTDKYDYLLPEELLAKSYAANMLDRAALARLKERLG
jgi:hypothetical protein